MILLAPGQRLADHLVLIRASEMPQEFLGALLVNERGEASAIRPSLGVQLDHIMAMIYRALKRRRVSRFSTERRTSPFTCDLIMKSGASRLQTSGAVLSPTSVLQCICPKTTSSFGSPVMIVQVRSHSTVAESFDSSRRSCAARKTRQRQLGTDASRMLGGKTTLCPQFQLMSLVTAFVYCTFYLSTCGELRSALEFQPSPYRRWVLA
jgi:hypothetical protein